MERPRNPHPATSLLAGGLAGGIEAASTYPFEFTKTRVQLHTRQPGSAPLPRNPYRIVYNLYLAEGLRAMYKGCGALIVGSIAKDAVRFGSFDSIKGAVADPATGTLTPARNLVAGMAAGVVASLTAVTPSERLKTALIDDAQGPRRFTSGLHAVRCIVAEDGVIGLYRGLVGTTLKQAGATAFRLGSYNILKDWERTRGVEQTTPVSFANGSVAGTVTTLATQPFDVIKTRSQTARVTTTAAAVRAVWQADGLRGFWRGTVMRLSRTVFSGGILFTSAEALTALLDPLFATKESV